jgi:hypothetical protein
LGKRSPPAAEQPQKPANGGRSRANLWTAHRADEAQMGSLLPDFSEPEDFPKSVDSSELLEPPQLSEVMLQTVRRFER